MFEEFFRDNSPADIEELSSKRKADIKAAVMKRVSQESEDKNMKKHNFFRPLLIAAAAVSVSAVSLVTANAATNGAVVDGITKMFTIIVNGEEYTVEAKYSEYDEGDMHIEQYEMEVPSSDGGVIGYSFISATDGEADGDGDVDFEFILDSIDISDYDEVVAFDDIDISKLIEEDVKEFIEKFGSETTDVTFTWASETSTDEA
ncbi:MAG: hypothetical protein K2O14_13190 [Oscillospiraceae bacterium]|nr:hypothetical protein [Oscillospiraceae bacterium]